MLINIIGFNLSWFGLVLFGTPFVPITLCWLAVHIAQSQNGWKELSLIFTVTAIGVFTDSMLVQFGIFYFPHDNIIPLWLVTLWASFAATIGHSLAFLKKSIYLQIIAGAIFAPLSYLAGASFSAVVLPKGNLITALVLAAVWPCLMVIFYKYLSNIQLKKRTES